MSRPSTETVDAALSYTTDVDEYEGFMGPAQAAMSVLRDEVRALRHDLEYERTLRNGLERMLKELDTQLTAADEVLP